MTGALRLVPWDGAAERVAPDLAPIAAQTIAILTENPRDPPWGCYLAEADGAIVGTCAFKAAPDGEGTVEIAYMTFPPHEARGHAAAMIDALLRIAEGGGVATVIAHTLPALNASARALRRNGFVHADAFDDPEDGPVWYWERVLEDRTMADELTGGCQCGAVRYRISGERPSVYACHCRECQKQSASAFGLSLAVRAADFAVAGALGCWERETDSGSRTRCYFCPACGSRVYHMSSRGAESVTVKGGSLDDTSWLRPIGHIWVSRKQPWVVLDPAMPAHETQPGDFAAWRRAASQGEAA